jgi:1,4-alpha-glucan branching enzyme
MSAGSFTFVLHSHLPWVLHHGRWPHGVDWLNEAAAETYLPVWRTLHDRTRDRRPLGVTLDPEPRAVRQLAHPDFPRELVAYFEQKIAAAAADRAEFERTGEAHLVSLARDWETFYRTGLEDFLGPHGTNLVQRFRRLEEAGGIEIITCGATHGYFPLLGTDAAIEGQVRTARAAHAVTGREPRGIWLPECALAPAGPDLAAVARSAAGPAPRDRGDPRRTGHRVLLRRPASAAGRRTARRVRGPLRPGAPPRARG